MKEFRVWIGLQRSEYKDVKGKDIMSVARRFFGRSKNLSVVYDNVGTAQIAIKTKNGYNVQGCIREF